MSTRSLSIFLQMFINNGYPVFSSHSIVEMKKVVDDDRIRPYRNDATTNFTNALPSRRYGLCWHWRTLRNGHQYLGHGGLLPGMTHLMLVNELHNIGIIIVTNANTNVPIDLTQKIYETIEEI